MKIKAAVLQAMGAALPYADSRPLHIEEIDLDDGVARHGRVLGEYRASQVVIDNFTVTGKATRAGEQGARAIGCGTRLA